MSATGLSKVSVRFLCVGLITVLVSHTLAPALRAQVTAEPKLRIQILEGEGAINNIRQRTAREPIVQVEDENHRPVAGAMILFTLPDRGASGVFADGSKTLIAYTDAQGRAVAKGLKPNSTEGQFQIQVNASFQGSTAQAVINQANRLTGAAVAGGISGKLIAILAIAGGAAAAGVVAATRNGSPPQTVSPPPPPTITAGQPTVGSQK
jgi:hypothetical protein